MHRGVGEKRIEEAFAVVVEPRRGSEEVALGVLERGASGDSTDRDASASWSLGAKFGRQFIAAI